MFPFPLFGRPLNRQFGFNDLPITYTERLLQSVGLVALYPLSERTGTTATELKAANNGAYTGTVTLAQQPLGDGNLYPSFGGGRVTLAAPLAALSTLFNGNEGTINVWCRVLNVGVWTDATSRSVCEFGADINNRILLNKTALNNTLQWFTIFGGTTKNPSAVVTPFTTWFTMSVTWSKSADQLKAYLNGVQQGATVNGLGTFAGALNASWTAIADFNSSAASNPWSGSLAYCALWNRALSAAEILGLYNPVYASN